MSPLLGFIRKEFYQALRDPRMKLLIFVLPIIQLTLFGFALSTDVKNIKLAIIAPPRDVLSQKLKQRVIAAKEFILVPTQLSVHPLSILTSRSAEAVLIIDPPGLSPLNKGPQLLISAINNLRAQAIERYVNLIYLKTMPPINKKMVVLQTQIHYNPTLESAIYMIPGVMCMIVCILTIVLTSMAMSREKELGTFEMLIASPITKSEIILGKTIPYFILGTSNIPLIMIAGILIFDLPVRGSILALGIASLVFVATTVSIGVLISSFAKNQQQGMLGGFLFLFPATMLSGIMFPLENMPYFLKWMAFINPLAHFTYLIRNIFLKGGSLTFVMNHLLILMVIGFISISVSIGRLKKQL